MGKGILGLANAIDKLRQAKKKQEAKLTKKIEDEAKYLAKMLHNAPARTKAQDPDRQKSAGTNYVALNQPNLIWYPNPNGGEPYTDGTTVAEFMKKIRSEKTTERTTHTARRYKGKYKRDPRGKGGFARTGTGKRIWEEKQTGATYEKGTVRTSQKERDYLQGLKSRERELNRRLKSKDRNNPTLSRLRRNMRKLERQAKRRTPPKNAQAKLSRSRQAYQEQKQLLKVQRQAKLIAAQQKQQRHYRIVGNIQKPRVQTFLRAVRPETVRTWYGDGGPEKYLGKYWQVDTSRKFLAIVSLHPLDDDFPTFRAMESGGTIDPPPVLVGYLVTFEDESSAGKRWKQRRVRFVPKTIDKKSANVRPRNFVKKTLTDFRNVLKNKRQTLSMKVRSRK